MNGNVNYPLYEDVREKICRKIFEGVFEEGKRIPAERTLAETLNVSRITLRKSLDLLVERELIIKEVGSGNRVSLPNYGTASNTDMIVLIAPAENPFFSDFIKRFQEYGQEYGSMILYVEKPYKESLADSIYRFYQKGIQNIVIWPEDAEVDIKKLKRLRALGMNLVFFDTDVGIPYADSIVLNNELALETIYEKLMRRKISDIGYVGWMGGPEYSGKLREKIILDKPHTRRLIELPWNDREICEERLLSYLKNNINELPEAIVYSDMESGLLLFNSLKKIGKEDVILAGIDEFQGGKQKGSIVCRQDFKSMIQKIFDCIEAQNVKGRKWMAKTYQIEGDIIEY